MTRETDRWFYLFLALLFVATAVTGFAPNSVAILSGDLLNPPLVVHLHAATMAAWLVLLLTQASLMAVGRKQWHFTLGLASFALAPLLVIMMIWVAIARFNSDYHGTALFFIQFRRAALFSVFFVWAIAVRINDPESHKRLVFLATLVLLDAALLRMPWLPTFASQNFTDDNIIHSHSWQLLLLVPALMYDYFRLGQVHPVHKVGLGLLIVTAMIASLLW